MGTQVFISFYAEVNLLLPVLWFFSLSAGEASANEDEEPAQKKKQEQLNYVQSEEFQKILNAKSRHGVILQAVWPVTFGDAYVKTNLVQICKFAHLQRIELPLVFMVVSF